MAFMTPSAIAEEAARLGKAKTLMGWRRLLVLGFLAGAYIALAGQLAVTVAAGVVFLPTYDGVRKAFPVLLNQSRL